MRFRCLTWCAVSAIYSGLVSFRQVLAVALQLFEQVLAKNFKLQLLKFIHQVPFSQSRNFFLFAKWISSHCVYLALHQFYFQNIVLFLYIAYYLQCFYLKNNILMFTVFDDCKSFELNNVILLQVRGILIRVGGGGIENFWKTNKRGDGYSGWKSTQTTFFKNTFEQLIFRIWTYLFSSNLNRITWPWNISIVGEVGWWRTLKGYNALA